jgi:hypothetical protein
MISQGIDCISLSLIEGHDNIIITRDDRSIAEISQLSQSDQIIALSHRLSASTCGVCAAFSAVIE